MTDAANRTLAVFAKWPTPGRVKTRLGASPEWAAHLAHAFLLDTLQRLAGVPARRLVVFAPPEARGEFAAVAGERFGLLAQAGGDLGARLTAFFAAEFASGASRVVAVGTDSPDLPVAFVERAFALLEENDVVLGPATDGGYYLVGCRERLPPIFEGIGWSTAEVLRQTVERLSGSEWRLGLLPPWYDVDTAEGWEMMRGHLAALRRAGIDPGVPRTEALAGSAGEPGA